MATVSKERIENVKDMIETTILASYDGYNVWSPVGSRDNKVKATILFYDNVGKMLNCLHRYCDNGHITYREVSYYYCPSIEAINNSSDKDLEIFVKSQFKLLRDIYSYPLNDYNCPEDFMVERINALIDCIEILLNQEEEYGEFDCLENYLNYLF
jgi:hypothetical protein